MPQALYKNGELLKLENNNGKKVMVQKEEC